MKCSNCQPVKPVPSCGGVLNIGTVESEQPTVFVFIKNNATGYVAVQEADNTPGEPISIDLSDPYPDFFSPNFYFTLWVSDTEDGNTPLMVTVEVDAYAYSYECFTLLFRGIYKMDAVYSLDAIDMQVVQNQDSYDDSDYSNEYL